MNENMIVTILKKIGTVCFWIFIAVAVILLFISLGIAADEYEEGALIYFILSLSLALSGFLSAFSYYVIAEIVSLLHENNYLLNKSLKDSKTNSIYNNNIPKL